MKKHLVTPKLATLNDYGEFDRHIKQTSYVLGRIDETIDFWNFSKSRYKCLIDYEFIPNSLTYTYNNRCFIKIAVFKTTLKYVTLMAECIGNKCFIYVAITDPLQTQTMIIPIFYDQVQSYYFIPLLDKLPEDNFDMSGMFDNSFYNPYDEILLEPDIFSKGGTVRTLWKLVTYKIPMYEYSAPIIDILKYMDLTEQEMLKVSYQNNWNIGMSWNQQKDEWYEQVEIYRPSFFPQNR